MDIDHFSFKIFLFTMLLGLYLEIRRKHRFIWHLLYTFFTFEKRKKEEKRREKNRARTCIMDYISRNVLSNSRFYFLFTVFPNFFRLPFFLKLHREKLVMSTINKYEQWLNARLQPWADWIKTPLALRISCLNLANWYRFAWIIPLRGRDDIQIRSLPTLTVPQCCFCLLLYAHVQ